MITSEVPPDAPLPRRRSPEPDARRIAANREHQRELYGAPVGELVRRLVEVLGVSQARLARTLGMSPAMLSQLVSARRVKIGDPVVLARLQMLDHRCAALAATPPQAEAVDRLLAEVGRARWRWAGTDGARAAASGRVRAAEAAAVAAARVPCPVEALRRVYPPARLAAAAAVLGPAFPELADVLRRAAVRR
ncbi:helix-turn-helix domain-containing protein [Pseudonocardia sp.]|uniref:helix-turn-helix domain-containing protein n=1 Tax=Pseudonocardia sp. TaxID=60912 RepID=UPI003D0D5E32